MGSFLTVIPRIRRGERARLPTNFLLGIRVLLKRFYCDVVYVHIGKPTVSCPHCPNHHTPSHSHVTITSTVCVCPDSDPIIFRVSRYMMFSPSPPLNVYLVSELFVSCGRLAGTRPQTSPGFEPRRPNTLLAMAIQQPAHKERPELLCKLVVF